jgi:membrane peptidoglycan carboxypeptidase
LAGPHDITPSTHNRRPRSRRIRSIVSRLVLGVTALAFALAVALVAYGALVVEPAIAPVAATAPARVRAALAARRGDFLSLHDMGTWLPRATIAVEDRRFYAHGAVDPLAAARALLYDARVGRPEQGGGTIDEQLAERLLLYRAVDPVTHVLRVLLMASRLDQLYGKAGVLTLYLNDIYYGRGAYGAGAAARIFFGVPPAQLTPAQASFLAGLPNLPSVFGDHPTQRPARARWQIVLRAMVRAAQLTSEQARQITRAGPPPLRGA